MAKAKRILKRIALGLVTLVALALIANAVASWWVGRKFDARIAALRAAGQPASIADLAPDPVPPDQDAAVLLQRVATDVHACVNEAYKIYDPGDEELSDEQLAQLRRCLAAYEHIFSVIHEASLRPQYRSQVDYSQPYEAFLEGALLDSVQETRGFARALRIRTDVLLADGQREEAMQAGLDLLRLSRHWDQEPAIVGYLVALACRGISVDMINRTLRNGPVSPAARAALDTELALHDRMAGFKECFRTERAYSLDAYRNMMAGWQGEFFMWWPKPSAVAMVDQFDQIIAIADRPWYETRRERTQLKKAASEYIFAALLFPAIQSAWDAKDRVRTYLRCLRILNAAQAYQEKNGREPKELADMGLPEEVTTDPFTGESLKWKKTDAGWLIYSVGRDGIDNGGIIDFFTDCGIGPVGWKPPYDESPNDESADDDQPATP